MIREIRDSLAVCLLTFLLCAVAYPAVVWGLAWSLFPEQAGGSLIERDGTLIGSELIAQPFHSDKYLHPRPSAVDYKADAAGGSNLGTKNPALRQQVADRAKAVGATVANPAPTDLVSASGGGLDPDISVEAARYQAARIARARNVPDGSIRELIDRLTTHSGAIVGAPPRVNVLRFNLTLDAKLPTPTSATTRDVRTKGRAAASSTLISRN